MCNYKVLSKSAHGVVQWCPNCQTYNFLYNNIAISFVKQGFGEFKEQVDSCYSKYSKCNCKRDVRFIVFSSMTEGMSLLFSVNEIGEILSLLQEAGWKDPVLADTLG